MTLSTGAYGGAGRGVGPGGLVPGGVGPGGLGTVLGTGKQTEIRNTFRNSKMHLFSPSAAQFQKYRNRKTM